MLKKLRELSLNTHFGIRTVITVIGVMVFLIFGSSGRNDMNAGTIIGLILVIIGILWHFLFVRCPHCSSPLRLRGGIPKHCPQCGRYIDKFH